MLTSIRDGLKYWKWVLILIGLSFVLFFGTDWWSDPGGGMARAVPAEVNGTPIDPRAWRNEAQRTEERFRQLYGPQWEQIRQQLNIRQIAAENLIQRHLILEDAARLNLSVTDAELSSVIKSLPQFQNESGDFDVQMYNRMRATQKEAFQADLRRDVIVEKWFNLVRAAAVVTPDEVESEFKRRNEKVSLEYVALPLEDYKNAAEPSETELQAWYDARRDEYAQGDARRAVYVMVDQASVADRVEITDAETESYYNDNPELFRRPAQRRARHVLISVEPTAAADDIEKAGATARSIYDRAASGEDFGQLAAEFSGDPGSKDNGGDLGFFGRGQMVPEFDEAVFTMAVGDISEPVRTQFGYHVIKLEEVRESEVPPIDEVREAIRSTLRFPKLKEVAAELAGQVAEKAKANGLNAAATELGLELQDTGVVSRRGSIPGIGAAPELISAMFDLEPNQPSEVISLPRGDVVLSVQDLVEDYVPPLALNRVEVLSNYLDEQASAMAKQALQKAMEKSADLSRIARSVKVDRHETEQPISRGSFLQVVGVDPAVEQALFSAGEGDVVGPVVGDRGVFLGKVITKSEPDMAQLTEQWSGIEASLRGPMVQAMINERVGKMRDAADVQLNAEMMEEPGRT